MTVRQRIQNAIMIIAMYFKAKWLFGFWPYSYTWIRMYISHFLLGYGISPFRDIYDLIIIIVVQCCLFRFYPNIQIHNVHLLLFWCYFITHCMPGIHNSIEIPNLICDTIYSISLLLTFFIFDLQIGEQTMKAIIQCSCCANCWCYGDH